MAKYQVFASEVVFHVIEVEADNEEQAIDKAWESYDGWKPFEHDNWQIETAKLVENESEVKNAS